MAKSTQELINLIDEKIEGLINNPEVSYKIGSKTVSASDKIKQLREMRTELIKTPDAETTFMAFDFSVSEFGKDKSQVIP